MAYQSPERDDHESEIESLLEDAKALRDAIGELIGDVKNGQPEAIKSLAEACGAAAPAIVGWRLGAALSISSGQHTPLNCCLPNHNHALGLRFYQCQKNPSHVFCRSHHLSKCVLQNCGGHLK